MKERKELQVYKEFTVKELATQFNPGSKNAVVVSLVDSSDIEEVRERLNPCVIVGWQDGVDVFCNEGDSVTVLNSCKADYFVVNVPPTKAEEKICEAIKCEIQVVEFGEKEKDAPEGFLEDYGSGSFPDILDDDDDVDY